MAGRVDKSKMPCNKPKKQAHGSGPSGKSEKKSSSPLGPQAIKVFAIFVSQSFEDFGKSKLLEKTPLKGSRLDFPLEVKRGLSTRTVPPPTMTASHFDLI